MWEFILIIKRSVGRLTWPFVLHGAKESVHCELRIRNDQRMSLYAASFPFSCNCVAFPETSLPVSCLRARWMQSQAFSWALINISKQSWVNIRYLQSCSHAREDTSAPVRLTSNRSGSSRCFNIVANSTRCNKTYKKHNYSWKIKQIELHKRDGKCERLQTWTIWKHTTYALIFFSCCYQDTCMTDLTGSPFFCCCYAWQTGCSTQIQTHVKWIKKKNTKSDFIYIKMSSD